VTEEAEVFVEKLVAGGYALAQLPDGMKILLKGGYPEEFVRVRLTRRKSDLAFGEVTQVISPSPFRVKPVCRHFGDCGGCQWQDYTYEEQLRWKQRIVEEQLQRIGGITVDVGETVPSPKKFHYRNMAELTFSGKNLGFRRWRGHSVIDIHECYLAPRRFTEIAREIKSIVELLEIPFYNWKSGSGVLKHVVMRASSTTGELMAIVVTKTETLPKAKMLRNMLLKKYPDIYLVHVMNSRDAVVLRGPYRILNGEGVLTENMDWFTFQIPPTAFFQVNTEVAQLLAFHVFEEIAPSRNDRVLDLYSGVGLFAINVAPHVKRCVGVESSRVAVKAAKANANINRLRNVEFVNASAEELNLNEGEFNKVILDPPRQGLEKRVVELLFTLNPERIVYVSCDTASLARDLKRLVRGGYSVVRVKPFDMFPHTHHVESVATLVKK